MTDADALESGRESFRLRAWGDALAQLAAADRESPLEPADLELLVTASYLAGRDDEAADLSARAYHQWLSRGDWARAARRASWLALHLLLRGEEARGGGWVARSRRLVDESQSDCVEQGY